jgi:DNA-binding CsgD family transcriptional regulator
MDGIPCPSLRSTSASALVLHARGDAIIWFEQGLDNDAIGKQLHISKRAARNHVSLIFSKLGAISRAQVIARARDAGFGRNPRADDPLLITFSHARLMRAPFIR